MEARGFEPRTSCLPGKRSAAELYPHGNTIRSAVAASDRNISRDAPSCRFPGQPDQAPRRGWRRERGSNPRKRFCRPPPEPLGYPVSVG